jgi:hypothetical protein
MACAHGVVSGTVEVTNQIRLSLLTLEVLARLILN